MNKIHILIVNDQNCFSLRFLTVQHEHGLSFLRGLQIQFYLYIKVNKATLLSMKLAGYLLETRNIRLFCNSLGGSVI